MSSAKNLGIAVALTFGGLMGFHAPEAKAGDVSNASLACYVDTTAYDQLTSGYCASGWTPNQPNPTIAYFQVVGLAAGSYTYTWSYSGCGSTANWCSRSIKKDTSGGQPITLSVTIRDNATGATKTVSATAEYVDVWN